MLYLSACQQEFRNYFYRMVFYHIKTQVKNGHGILPCVADAVSVSLPLEV